MAINQQMTQAVTEALEGEISGKKWYYSKTFWTNIVASVTVIAQVSYGFVFPAEYQMLALTMINLALRKISTGAVTW